MMANSSSIDDVSQQKRCVCGNAILIEFSPDYLKCEQCETLVARPHFDFSVSEVTDDQTDLYGRNYWYAHQKEMGYPDIEIRSWEDLGDRCIHWLSTLLKYKAPPARVLEIGCAHGGFVALLNWAGFEATGLELSPTIAEFAEKTFSVPVLVGPIEQQNLPEESYDVIALMDVLEHLPNPELTMRQCIDLLKPDGILLIQTPQYREGREFGAMASQGDSFLQLLKPDEHVYLFSAQSLKRLFSRIGVGSIRWEPAIFAHYDQFVVIGKSVLETREVTLRGSHRPSQRLVQAMLDQRSRLETVRRQWFDAEKDRADRLNVIEEFGTDLGTIGAERNHLKAQLDHLNLAFQHSEADREARLRVIQDLSAKLQASEAGLASQLAAIEDLAIKLQTSEAAVLTSAATVNELSTRLDRVEMERAQLQKSIVQAKKDREALADSVEEFERSRTGSLLRALGLSVPRANAVTGGFGPACIPLDRHPKPYSLPAFRSEFVNSRPDLQDVRGYNRKMLEIFADLRSFKDKSLLDIGASPHGFALERALELGIREYCGIGLGIGLDVAVKDGPRRGTLLGMDAEEMSLPSEAFDLIITLSTFEHFFHPEKVLREMHRVLKPGGAALIDFQPVWTSIRGHHLHHIPEVSKLLPPWAHLLWTKEELVGNLSAAWPSSCSMTIEQVAHWIYESDEINRLEVEVLRHALENSPLAVEWLTPNADDLSESELAAASEVSTKLSQSVENLKIRGFSALLVRR